MLQPSSEFNTTLKRKDQIQEYIDLAQQAGYVHRHDPPKNWDNYKALKWTLARHTDREVNIMDAGGIPASSYLPTLSQFGYTRLVALDLSNPHPPKLDREKNITYKRGDITDTKYPDAYFTAVACLSVIEHGVPLDAFFQEMARVIKSGGSLMVSTDYWDEKVENPDGRMAYGVPVHIFSRQEMEEAIRIAAQHGFSLSDEPDFDCEERTVSWMGFQYTFILLCFTRA